MIATVKEDPIMITERKLSQIIIKNRDHIPPKIYRQLLQHYSKLSHIYSLPEILKDGIPLKPVVSCQSSVCHPQIRSPVDIIEPLIGKLPSYVRKSVYFVEIIKDVPIQSNQRVSLDVVSLFHQGTQEGGTIGSQGQTGLGLLPRRTDQCSNRKPDGDADLLYKNNWNQIYRMKS